MGDNDKFKNIFNLIFIYIFKNLKVKKFLKILFYYGNFNNILSIKNLLVISERKNKGYNKRINSIFIITLKNKFL